MLCWQVSSFWWFRGSHCLHLECQAVHKQWLPYPEKQSTTVPQNARNYSPGDKVPLSRGRETSEIPMWEPKFLLRSEYVRIVTSCVRFMSWLLKPWYWLAYLPVLPPWTAPQTRALAHKLSAVTIAPYEQTATSPSGRFGTPARSHHNSPHIPQRALGQIWTRGFSPNTEMTRPLCSEM